MSESKPNILFVMSDDHAAHAIGCYGSKINETPNTDQIAAEGVRFDNCFCTNSICTPSRATILTGQYSHLNGVYTLADALDGEHLNVAKLLRNAGYQTAIIGKWHLKNTPTGFNYWDILPGQGRYINPIMNRMGEEKEHEGYVTDIITDLSLEWLNKRDRHRPFLLLCHHKSPHSPWIPDKKHMDMYENMKIHEPPNLLDDYSTRSNAAANAKLKLKNELLERWVLRFKRLKPPSGLCEDALIRWVYQLYIKDYLRCVASIDDNIGRLLSYLDNEGLTDDTMVIYTSDQGMFLGEHGYFDKRFMYEESLRMPFIIRYPRHIKPGTVNSDIILNTDFAPLFLDYSDTDVPSEMQGRSFRLNAEGEPPEDWRNSFYYRYWMHLAHHWVPAHYGVRTKRHKIIYYYGQALGKNGAIDQQTKPEWELFDLEKDPYEMKNVYNDPEKQDVICDLKRELERLAIKAKDTL